MSKQEEDQRSIIALHKAINDFNSGKFLEMIPEALSAKVKEYKALQADETNPVGRTINRLQELSELADLEELAKPEKHIGAWSRKISQWDKHDKLDAFHIFLTSNKLYQQINNGSHGVHEKRSVWDLKNASKQGIPLLKGYNTKNLMDTFKEYGISLEEIDHKHNFMLTDLIDHKIMANLIPHDEMLTLRTQDRYLGLKKMPEDVGIEFPEFRFHYVDNTFVMKLDNYYELLREVGIKGGDNKSENNVLESKLMSEYLKEEMKTRETLKKALMQRDKDIENNAVDLELLAQQEAEKELAQKGTPAEKGKEGEEPANDGADVGVAAAAGVAAGVVAGAAAAGKDNEDKDEPEEPEEEREKTEEELEFEAENKDYSAENIASAPFMSAAYKANAETPRSKVDDDIPMNDPDEPNQPELEHEPAASAPRNDTAGAEEIPSKVDSKEQPDITKNVQNKPPQMAQNVEMGQPVYDPLYGLGKGISKLFGGGARSVKNAFDSVRSDRQAPMPTMTEMAGGMEAISQSLQTSSGADLTGAIEQIDKIKAAYEFAGDYKADRMDNPAAKRDVDNSLDIMRRVDENIKNALDNNSELNDEDRRKLEDIQKNIQDFMSKLSDLIAALASRFTGRGSSPSL